MAYKSLYRTYRPHSFSDVVGQKHIVKTLQNAIKRDQLAHAYLFSGPRGTGKTTIAKLLARGVNCLNPLEAPCGKCDLCEALNSDNHPDIIEIDAASNNGVDDVRDLIERVKYAPLQGKYKVYIIDEVHMLSTGAFNALLKTLEEPPTHVIFILATTEIHKVLPTIVSRCQRYDFSRVSLEDLISRLNYVLDSEHLEREVGVVEKIAQLADGGFRDALSICEQVIAYSDYPLSLQDVYDVYKISTPEHKTKLISMILEQNLPEALEQLKLAETQSIDYKRFIFDLIELCKETLIASVVNSLDYTTDINKDSVQTLLKYPQKQVFQEIVEGLLTIQQEAKFSGYYANYLELLVIQLCQSKEKSELPVQKNKPAQEVSPEPTPLPAVETTPIESPKVSETKVVSLTPQQILACMVLGDREIRMKDQEVFHRQHLFTGETRRIERLIPQIKVGVSTDQWTLLVVDEDIKLNVFIPEIYSVLEQFTQQQLNKKQVFVVGQTQFDQTTKQFLTLHKQGQLPSKQDCLSVLPTVNEAVETESKNPETILKELFGEFRIEE